MDLFLPWFAIGLTVLGLVGGVIGFVWARASFEATMKAGLDKIGSRLGNQEDRFADAVELCNERMAEVRGRVSAIEGRDLLTVTEHRPMQESCRSEIFHMIKSTDKKVDKAESTMKDMSNCLHRMDKNIATLLAYNNRGETA